MAFIARAFPTRLAPAAPISLLPPTFTSTSLSPSRSREGFTPNASIPMTDEQLIEGLTQMTLQELKRKPPTEILALAESLEIEGANTLRTQDMLFAILKQVAERGVEIGGEGVVEILPDGFGFLRSPQSNYLDRKSVV